MNTKTDSRWSDDDLQRHLDGEMAGDRRAAITADLFTDPSLRDRLDRLAAIDEMGRRALCEDAPTMVDRRKSGAAYRKVALGGIAAVIALTSVGVVWRAVANRAPAAPMATMAPAPAPNVEPTTEPAAELTYSQQRLILTIPVAASGRPLAKRARFASRKIAAPPNEADAVDLEIDSALVRGHAEEALGLLAQSNVADRAEQWSRLGALMQSAQRAREALLFLPVDQQIEIVRVWANDPSLRPVVFERLGELVRDPATATAAQALRAQLAQNPQLKSWVTSYASARGERLQSTMN